MQGRLNCFNHVRAGAGGCATGDLAEPLPEPLGAASPIVPCHFTGAEAAAAPALVAASCAARKHRITVVYDTGDAVKCAPQDPYNVSEYCHQCPLEGVMRFNTQVQTRAVASFMHHPVYFVSDSIYKICRVVSE
jgi:hypothetical protein